MDGWDGLRVSSIAVVVLPRMRLAFSLFFFPRVLIEESSKKFWANNLPFEMIMITRCSERPCLGMHVSHFTASRTEPSERDDHFLRRFPEQSKQDKKEEEHTNKQTNRQNKHRAMREWGLSEIMKGLLEEGEQRNCH